MNPNHCRCSWTVEWDEPFFRLVQSVFPPTFLEAASGLLASYDDAYESAPVGAGR
jgi:hypothetical protein